MLDDAIIYAFIRDPLEMAPLVRWMLSVDHPKDYLHEKWGSSFKRKVHDAQMYIRTQGHPALFDVLEDGSNGMRLGDSHRLVEAVYGLAVKETLASLEYV
jgi:hypothetical protein